MKVTNVLEILESLEDIETGWMDIEKNIYKNMDKGFKKKYVLASPEDTLKSKVGTCFDLVEVERTFFKSLGLKYNAYFMIYYESKRIYTHAFIVYEENEKFYWFESSWHENKGIHEYMSLFDLLTDVKKHFIKNNNIKFMDNDYLCVYKYKKPKYHIGLKELYKHCENGENVII